MTKLDRRDFNSLFIYGYCLDAQNKYSAAQRIYQKVTKYDPKHSEAWRNLGLTHERKGSKKAMTAALRCYRIYVKLGGKDKATVQTWVKTLELKLDR